MNVDKYKRSIALMCPTCGNTELECVKGINDSVEIIHCPSCNREFTKDEMIRENQDNIEAHLNEIGEEITKDIASDFHQKLKNALKGSKNIRIK